MIVRFRPEAEKEFRQATHWYAQQRSGLDLEFIGCIDEAIERIKRQPLLFPKERDDIRKTVVRRFPFLIFFFCVKAKHYDFGNFQYQ